MTRNDLPGTNDLRAVDPTTQFAGRRKPSLANRPLPDPPSGLTSSVTLSAKSPGSNFPSPRKNDTISLAPRSASADETGVVGRAEYAPSVAGVSLIGIDFGASAVPQAMLTAAMRSRLTELYIGPGFTQRANQLSTSR